MVLITFLARAGSPLDVIIVPTIWLLGSAHGSCRQIYHRPDRRVRSTARALASALVLIAALDITPTVVIAARLTWRSFAFVRYAAGTRPSTLLLGGVLDWGRRAPSRCAAAAGCHPALVYAGALLIMRAISVFP
jgi:hypothetical protein